MRGVKRIHRYFPVKNIWDSGVAGGTPDSREYREYMELRREVSYVTKQARKYEGFGRTRLRIMNAKNDELLGDANAQSIVMKVQHHHPLNGNPLGSLMLTGDSDAQAWRRSILSFYGGKDVQSSILLASHHGSISFFDDPDDQHYYTDHIMKIKPQMTVISVGANSHGHPDANALKFYEKYTSGSAQGNKIYRTDEKGSIKLVLKDEGGWVIDGGQ